MDVSGQQHQNKETFFQWTVNEVINSLRVNKGVVYRWCVCVTVGLHTVEVFHAAHWLALTQIPAHSWESERSRLSNCCSLPSWGSRQTAHVIRPEGYEGHRLTVCCSHTYSISAALLFPFTLITLPFFALWPGVTWRPVFLSTSLSSDAAWKLFTWLYIKCNKIVVNCFFYWATLIIVGDKQQRYFSPKKNKIRWSTEN